MNKSITKLVDKRLVGLNFNKNDITEGVFFSTVKKYSHILRTLQVTCPLRQLKKASFDKCIVRPTQLLQLNLIGFNNLTEAALSRFIDSSMKSLESFRISYRNQGWTQATGFRLAHCKKLKLVELGQSLDNFEKIPYDNLNAVKQFVKRKQSKLETLRLYECDEEILNVLARTEVESLEELQIVKFIQKKEGSV